MASSPAREAMQRDVKAAETPPTVEGGGPGKAAVDALANGDKITATAEAEATAWYLDEDYLDSEPATHAFQIDLAPYKADKRRLVTWVIQPVDRDYIQQIRKENTRREGTREEVNDMGVNLALVVAATVEPDLRDPRVRGVYQDPADVLRLRFFRHKSGLIDQIANKVMAVSGYDDEDVAEVEAAKNSS